LCRKHVVRKTPNSLLETLRPLGSRRFAATEQPNTKMRKHTKYVGALAAASALVAGYASAEIEGDVHVGYSSNYEFRFVDLGSDLIEAGADVSYEIAEGFALSGGLWYGSVNDSSSSFVVAPAGPGLPATVVDNSFNELDLYAAVSKEIGPVTLELGYIYYTYLDSDIADTQEVYLGASYEIGWGVTAGATYYYDFDQLDGWYLQPELSKTFEFNDCLALNLSTGVGIADGHGGQVSDKLGSNGTADGFQGWFVKAELPWEFREGFTLAPYVKYVDADDKLVSDTPVVGGTGTLGGREHLVAGVKVSVGF
jgi:uncharacterized protein (TIGR02001 family)